jgi:serine protease
MINLKRYSSLLAISCLLLVSCSERPTADCTYSPAFPVAGQPVQFNNKSTNARSYSWNFGDASIGDDENPSHVYEQPGEYIVDISAFKGLKSDIMTVTIVVGN